MGSWEQKRESGRVKANIIQYFQVKGKLSSTPHRDNIRKTLKNTFFKSEIGRAWFRDKNVKRT